MMRRLVTGFGVALCLAASLSAQAADGAPRCKRDGNTQEMKVCAMNDYKVADRRLNKVYKALMAATPEARKTSLRDEQRAWLNMRDPTCMRQTEGEKGGTIWPLEFVSCQQEKTQARTQQLEVQLDSLRTAAGQPGK